MVFQADDDLLCSFSTRYGLPVGKYSLSSRLNGKYAGRSVLAEISSFSLEFGRLAQITGNSEYYDVVHRAGDYLATHSWRGELEGEKKHLLPTFLDDSEGIVEGSYGRKFASDQLGRQGLFKLSNPICTLFTLDSTML